MNLGGYVAQPPLLLTTSTAMEQMLSQSCYIAANVDGAVLHALPGTDVAAPISAIRVRVANVHGFEPIDRARILAVATAIKKDTGLQVDITAGSSPTTVDVDLPAGCCGEPALTVAEGWVRKGAALVVLNAVDAKSSRAFRVGAGGLRPLSCQRRVRACALGAPSWVSWRVSAGAEPHSSDSSSVSSPWSDCPRE